MVKKTYLISILIMGLWSCNSLKETTKQDITVSDKDQIIFHDFFAENTRQGIGISEVGREYRKGNIKETNIRSVDFHHPVEIVFLDKSGGRIKSLFIEHPLISEYEYANVDGSLGMVTSYRDSASFMLRYNEIKGLDELMFISNNQDTLAIRQNIQIRK